MKKFRVVVNGTSYEVEVEGLGSEGAISAAPAPATPVPAAAPAPVAAKPAAAPAPAPAAAPIVTDGVKVEAPMPGTILDIRVNPGDSVSAGDVLMILEAMKMENEITAPQDGTVKEIATAKGAAVNSGDLLAVLG